jgi:hypothetical protein
MESGLYEPRCLAERAEDALLRMLLAVEREGDVLVGNASIGENADAPGTRWERATADVASAAMARREYFVMVALRAFVE